MAAAGLAPAGTPPCSDILVSSRGGHPDPFVDTCGDIRISFHEGFETHDDEGPLLEVLRHHGLLGEGEVLDDIADVEPDERAVSCTARRLSSEPRWRAEAARQESVSRHVSEPPKTWGHAVRGLTPQRDPSQPVTARFSPSGCSAPQRYISAPCAPPESASRRPQSRRRPSVASVFKPMASRLSQSEDKSVEQANRVFNSGQTRKGGTLRQMIANTPRSQETVEVAGAPVLFLQRRRGQHRAQGAL
mmetsp:Transcript_14426/g.46159  ORF Transcript_14426/g.46159 Transcript_14426/m.46159 type:complete len:246 (-) Transcript_14426:49-786(-)